MKPNIAKEFVHYAHDWEACSGAMAGAGEEQEEARTAAVAGAGEEQHAMQRHQRCHVAGAGEGASARTAAA